MMKKANQANYLEATQDGIVRLIYNEEASKNVQGLYTGGLQSCIAIIIIGDQGISLIHNSGRITAATIKRECEAVGKIKYWTLAFYSKADEEYQQ